MRSTRATAAVERLKERSGNDAYAMVMNADGTFYLIDRAGDNVALNDPLPLEEFVAFVKAFGPQIPRRQTKSDIAFEKQLVRRKDK